MDGDFEEDEVVVMRTTPASKRKARASAMLPLHHDGAQSQQGTTLQTNGMRRSHFESIVDGAVQFVPGRLIADLDPAELVTNIAEYDNLGTQQILPIPDAVTTSTISKERLQSVYISHRTNFVVNGHASEGLREANLRKLRVENAKCLGCGRVFSGPYYPRVVSMTMEPFQAIIVEEIFCHPAETRARINKLYLSSERDMYMARWANFEEIVRGTDTRSIGIAPDIDELQSHGGTLTYEEFHAQHALTTRTLEQLSMVPSLLLRKVDKYDKSLSRYSGGTLGHATLSNASMSIELDANQALAADHTFDVPRFSFNPFAVPHYEAASQRTA
jgi:hypothetical protein